jgi:phage shock protein A
MQLGRKGMAELVDVAQTIVLAMIALSQIYSLRTMGAEMVKATRAAARAIGEQTELNRRVRNLEEEVAHLKRGTRVG